MEIPARMQRYEFTLLKVLLALVPAGRTTFKANREVVFTVRPAPRHWAKSEK
jgi:hypothetical protein